MCVLATGTIRGGVDGFVRRAGCGRGGYSSGILTQAETNIRLGMRYFKDLMNRFGGAHFALAGYNAPDSRSSAWPSGGWGFRFRCVARCRSRRASWNRTSDLANVPSPWRSPPSSRRRRRTTWRRTCSIPRGGSRRRRDSRSDYARARSIKVVRPGDNARFVLLARSDRTLLAHQDEGFRERDVSVSLGFDPRSLWQNVADFAVGDLERFEIRELHANPVVLVAGLVPFEEGNTT